MWNDDGTVLMRTNASACLHCNNGVQINCVNENEFIILRLARTANTNAAVDASTSEIFQRENEQLLWFKERSSEHSQLQCSQ